MSHRCGKMGGVLEDLLLWLVDLLGGEAVTVGVTGLVVLALDAINKMLHAGILVARREKVGWLPAHCQRSRDHCLCYAGGNT